MYNPDGKLKPIIKFGLILFGLIFAAGVARPFFDPLAPHAQLRDSEVFFALILVFTVYITITYSLFLLYKRFHKKGKTFRIIFMLISALVLIYLYILFPAISLFTVLSIAG